MHTSQVILLSNASSLLAEWMRFISSCSIYANVIDKGERTDHATRVSVPLQQNLALYLSIRKVEFFLAIQAIKQGQLQCYFTSI
jgi:hypothetical protein